MAKLKELTKYLDYEFSSGCYTGEDYLTFQRKYITYEPLASNAGGSW